MGEGAGVRQGGIVQGDQGRVSPAHARPHIYLKHSWSDNGWDYQQWACTEKRELWFGTKLPVGLGATPAAAYADWKRQVSK